MNVQTHSSDTAPEIALATLFIAVFLLYYSSLSLGADPRTVAFGWGLLFAYTIITTRLAIFGPIAAIHLILVIAYLSGTPITSPDGSYTYTYIRNIMASLVFSSLTVALLTNNWRRIKSVRISNNVQVNLHRAVMVGVFMWSLFTINHISLAGIVDVREVTGLSYLTTSDLLAISGLAILARGSISPLEYVLITLSVAISVSLFGSRAAMGLFSAIAVGGFLVRFRAGSVLTFGSMAASVTTYVALTYVNFSSVAFQRLTSLLSLMSNVNDPSLNARMELLDESLNYLEKHPACLLIPCLPEDGYYIHSALSLIQYFGVIGLGIIAVGAIVIVVKFNRIVASKYLPLFAYLFVSMITVRAWTSIIFPVFLAFLYYYSELKFVNRAPGKRFVDAVEMKRGGCS